MRIRRGAAAVIGKALGLSSHCHEAGRPSEVRQSRKPEDLPVESCSDASSTSIRAGRWQTVCNGPRAGGSKLNPHARPGGKVCIRAHS